MGKAILTPIEKVMASNCMMSDGETSVETKFTQIANKIGTEIKTITITGSTGSGSGAGNFTVYKSSYPTVKCLIPIGVSGGQYRAQISSETSTYWVISVNNATTGEWAVSKSVTVYAVAVLKPT
ncbi:MAG TPA: hypothetical protein PLB75_05915 [Paludibacteraceae bacterium]|nr:hypothetical protein [Paludibacteraceae bacterium]